MTVFGMVNGFLAQRMLLGDNFVDYDASKEELAEHTVSLLLNGLLDKQSSIS